MELKVGGNPKKEGPRIGSRWRTDTKEDVRRR